MAETTIVLETITCKEPSEPLGDTIYINYIIDGGRPERYPSKDGFPIKKNESWRVNLALSFKETVSIELYEHDFPGSDDYLGTQNYRPIDPQPEGRQIRNKNGADYLLSTGSR